MILKQTTLLILFYIFFELFNLKNINIIFGRDYMLYLCEPKYPDVLIHIYTTWSGDTVKNDFQSDIDTKQFNF